MLRPILLCLCMLLGLESKPVTQQSSTRFHSATHAQRMDSSGTAELVLLDANAQARTEVDPLSLAKEYPVFGPGQVFALLERAPADDLRQVRLLDARFRQLAFFDVSTSQDLLLGARGMLLSTRMKEGVGTRFQLEFLDLNGNTHGVQSREDLVLIRTQALGAELWGSVSVTRKGEFRVHCFSATGELLWARAANSSASPIMAANASGDRIALGRLQPGATRSQLELLNARGELLGSTSVPAFSSALFNPNGHGLALVGYHTLSYVSSATAQIIWSYSNAERFALGHSMAFSPSGDQLQAIAYRQAEDGSPQAFSLVEYRNLEARGTRRSRTLPELDGQTQRRIIDLQAQPDGRWRLVTEAAVWFLES